MIRVVFTGSESTGKTTLAAAVAAHYGVNAVPEFVRWFAEQKSAPIEFSDHGAIARGQMALEDEYIARAENLVPALPALVIQDTDLLSTVVYCRHYFNGCPSWIEEAAARRSPDFYFVCEIDAPWVDDGVRDREHEREEMQQLFVDAVKASGTPNVLVKGPQEVRLTEAIEVIDRLMARIVSKPNPHT